jgi:hypothetical protein
MTIRPRDPRELTKEVIMPRRERLKQPIQCSVCQKQAEAEFEEYETPPHHEGEFDKKLVSLPSGWWRKGDKYFCDEHSN